MSKSTVNTRISRLRDKGIFTHLDKYGAAQCVPLMSGDDFIHAEQATVIEKLGGTRKFVPSMVKSGHLTEADIDDPRRLRRR